MRARSVSLFLVVVLLGLLVRLPFLATDFSTSNDLDTFRRWARRIHERGLTEAYESSDINYPPIVLYAFGVSAALESRLPETWRAEDRALNALLKSWPLLADVAIAALLARFSAPELRCWAAAGYLLHPAVWYTSAHWGQLESVYTLFLLAALLALLAELLRASWVFFAVAAMTKPQAIALLPLMVGASLRHGGPRALATGIMTAAGAGVLAFLPWFLAGKADDLLRHWPFVHAGPPRVDVSAYNLWYLIFMGHVHVVSSQSSPFGLPFSYQVISAALCAAVALPVAVLLWRRRDLSMPLAAAILCLGFFLLPTEVHERFMFPALPFLLLSMLDRSRTGDRNELMGAWLLLSLTFSFNLVTIASPVPRLWTNLVAAPDAASPLVSILKVLAVVAAVVNLSVFARLVSLLARR